MLPPFTSEGVLPPGDYPLTLDELKKSALVVGPDGHPGWDHAWRSQLVDNLGILVGHLWQVDIQEIFADGSFTQDKGHPGDIDIYFLCDIKEFVTGMLAYRLNIVSGNKRIWSWAPEDRKPDSSGKPQWPMWHRFHIDVWPHFGQTAGRDVYGNELQFPAYFRQTRDGKPRGIVKIERGS